VLLLAAGCGGATTGGQQSSGQTGSKATYTITVDSDTTGVNGLSGVADSDGFQAYFATANKSGGVNGHHINVEAYNDNSDVPTALANYQKTLASNSLGFFQNNPSAVIAAVGTKATGDGIPESNTGGYMAGVGTFPYVYNENPSGPTFFKIVTTFAASVVSHPKGSKAAFIGYDSALVESYQPQLGKALVAKGFSMAYSQLVPPTTVDFSVAAGGISAAQPAIVVTDLQDQQIVPFVNGLRQRGYSGPIINFGSNASSTSMKKLDDPKMYLVQYTVDPLDTGDPDVAAVIKAANDTGFTQGLNQNFYIEAWVFAKIVAAAIGKCGDSCTRDSLNKALESTTVSGGTLMAGNPGFSPTNHIMTQSAVVDQWSNSNGYLTPIKGFGFAG
jgi:ABC-type branched-subunit amino acid transport system substrate-binding protein